MLIESSNLSLDELKTEWNRTKPQTYSGMVDFLKKVGLSSVKANAIMLKAGVMRLGRTKRSIVATDVAKEANIVPQVLKLLRDQYGLKESILRESVDNLTKEEVASVLKILFQIANNKTPSVELTRISSVESVEQRKNILLHEARLLADSKQIDVDTFKEYSVALLVEGLSWEDIDVVPVIDKESVIFEDSAIHFARSVLTYLL